MFTVEGIIGAGKSTLCKKLQEAGYVVAQEPLERWNVASHNLLECYYNNPSKYAYLFQCHVLRTLAENTQRMTPPPGFASFQERSIDSNAIFSRLQHQLGHMDDVEYDCYMDQYYKERGHPRCRVMGRIFLDVDIDTAMQRVSTRDRLGESSLMRDYQEQLLILHDEWKEKEMMNGRPVLVIDTVKDDVRTDQVIDAIRHWIQPLLP